MRNDYLYGSYYTATVASSDGRRYVAHIERHAYSGPVRSALPLVGLRISWGADGGAVTGTGPLAAVAASKAVLTVRDSRGVLAETVGSADGTWRLRVERLDGDVNLSPADGGPGTVWLGYLLPELYEDSPYAPSSETSLTFADGLGLLDARPLLTADLDPGEIDLSPAFQPPLLPPPPERYRDLLTPFALHLADLGADAQTGIVTAADWLPQIAGIDDDPVRALLTRAEVWMDADGGSVSVLAGLRQIAQSLGARLYQSGGRWHLTQRGMLARTQGVDVARHRYPASVTYPPPEQPATVDQVAVDTREWRQAGPHASPRRGITSPIRSVSAAFDVGDELETLLYNGSFETGDPDSNLHADGYRVGADGWTKVHADTDVARIRLSDSQIDGFDPATGDEFALRLRSLVTTSSRVVEVLQQVSFPLPGTSDWDLRMTAQVFSDLGESEPRAAAGGVRMRVTRPDGTEVWGNASQVALRGSVLPGEGGRLYVDALPGAIGARVLPVGAVLHFWRDGSGTGSPDDDYVGRAVIERDGLGGDTIVQAAVTLAGAETERLRSGDRTSVYYWAVDQPASMGLGWAPAGLIGTATPANGGLEFWATDLMLTGVADDGNPVSGDLNVFLFGSYPPFNGTLYVDDVRLALTIDGETGTSLGSTLSLPAGAAGLEVDLGDSPFGDGPKTDSVIGLYARDDVGDLHPTAGASWAGAGIQAGSLHALRSLDGLRQLAGPLERVRTSYLLRDGQALAPEHVAVHWPTTHLVYPVQAGADVVYTYAAPRIGRTLAIGDVDHTVTAVTRGAGLFSVELAEPVAEALPAGTRVAYDLAAWWDALDWDVPSGAVYYDATALDLDARPYLEEITLGTQ